MAITKIQAGALPAGVVTVDAIADTSITHAKLHTDMDLSAKTVVLPTLSTLDVSGNVTVAGTVDGVDIQTLNTAVIANTAKVTNYNQTKADIEALGIAASSITGALPAISGAALTDVAKLSVGTSAPSTPSAGDQWFDTTSGTNAMKVYSGSEWNQMSNKFTAAGGTVSVLGAYRYHTFTSSGTFTAESTGSVDVLVLAGGGGGGSEHGGGGGAGGLISSTLTATTGSFSVVVGSGGAGGGYTATNGGGYMGSNGANSSILGLTAIGGGGGGPYGNNTGNSGGSGGGSYNGNGVYSGYTAGQGNRGGSGYSGGSAQYAGGGGGGAGGVGGDYTGANAGTLGGVGINWLSLGTFYAGGGGGGIYTSGTIGAGGSGVGGNGGNGSVNATNGATNRGSGGGGSRDNTDASAVGGNGGSGIVIIRYLS